MGTLHGKRKSVRAPYPVEPAKAGFVIPDRYFSISMPGSMPGPPGGQVAMKITNVRTFLVDPGSSKNWLFVKVETDAGIHGWGSATPRRTGTAPSRSHVHALARYLVAAIRTRSSTSPSWPIPTSRASGARWTSTAPSAASSRRCGISSARRSTRRSTTCWAAPCRDKIRVYANGWGGSTPRSAGRSGAGAGRQGFTAMKFDPFPGPWRAHISRDDERAAVDACAPCGGGGSGRRAADRGAPPARARPRHPRRAR